MNWKAIFEILGDALGIVAIFGTGYAALVILHGMGW
jgi:hypothetical protein